MAERGGTITHLKAQIKNPERVSVFVNDSYSFSLSLSQILEHHIRKGKDLSNKEIQALKAISNEGKAQEKIFNWLTLRPRSSGELRLYLRKIRYEGDEQALMEVVATKGYQDDYRFAQWWVERRSRARSSVMFLRNELRAKGVDKDIITEVLGSNDDQARLIELVSALRKKTKYQDDRKLMTYLVSKGFSYSAVSEALKLGAGDRER